MTHRSHPSSEKGASLTEYALTVALIAVVCIGALSSLGKGFEQGYAGVAACIKEGGNPEVCEQISFADPRGPK